MVLEDEAVKTVLRSTTGTNYFNSQELVDQCSSMAALCRNNENVVQVCILMTSDKCVITKQVDKICISYTLIQVIFKRPQ